MYDLGIYICCNASKFTTEHEHISTTSKKTKESSASPKVQNSDMPPNNPTNNDKGSVTTTMSNANVIVFHISLSWIIKRGPKHASKFLRVFRFKSCKSIKYIISFHMKTE